jgi:Preprotein translocase subunit Sec63
MEAAKKPRHVFPTDLAGIEKRLRELEKLERQTAFEKGMLLKHVRDNDLTRGQWGKWLGGVGLDPSTATRYIQVYDQFGNHATSHELPTSKLFELVKLPPAVDRAEFLADHDVASMTVKELRELVKKKREAAGLVKPKPQESNEDDEDLSALNDVPYGTVKKIRKLNREQIASFVELARQLSGSLIADKYEEIKIEVNCGKPVADIVRRFKQAPGKTPIQTLGLDPYEVLGVNYGEHRSIVRDKYRALMQAIHPDKDGSEFLFKIVQSAWEAIR